MAGRRALAVSAGLPSSSLFIAIFPAPDAAAHIFSTALDLRTRLGLTGNVAASERLHVTLHWLGVHAGEPPSQLLSQARSAAASVSSAPMELTFDTVRSLFSAPPRPVVMSMRSENAALTELHGNLGMALLNAGFRALALKPFTPHITLLRDRKPVSSQPIAPVRWTANELVLVRSFLGESKYERLETWPFRPQEVS